MNSIKISSLCFFLLFTFSSLAQNEAFINAEKEVIKDLENRWSEALRTKDMDAVLSFIAPDIVIMLPDLPAIEGIDAVKELYEVMLGMTQYDFSSYIADIKAIEVSSSADLAVVRYTDKMMKENGESESGKAVDVFKKINGEWKAIMVISNNFLPEQAGVQPVPEEK